jgi:hypothetical protein
VWTTQASLPDLFCLSAASFPLKPPTRTPTLTVLPTENQRDPPTYLPVRALLQLGQHMLVSGGSGRPGSAPTHRLQLWDCKQQRPLKEFCFRCVGSQRM